MKDFYIGIFFGWLITYLVWQYFKTTYGVSMLIDIQIPDWARWVAQDADGE